MHKYFNVIKAAVVYKKLAKIIIYFSTMMLIGGEKIRYKKHLKVSIITLRNVKSYTYESNG